VRRRLARPRRRSSSRGEAEANRAALRNLLGLPAGTHVELAPSDAEPLRQPQGTDGAVLARPDLALATARFRVADAEFRAAVADQYPSLMLGPEFPLRGDPLELMAILRVPIGMAGRAEAARERREAARATLASAYVQASNGACTAERELAAAAAGETGAALSLRASTKELATARVALQVEIEGFDRYAKAAAMVVRDTMERRAATTAHVRARVQRAVALRLASHRERVMSHVDLSALQMDQPPTALPRRPLGPRVLGVLPCCCWSRSPPRSCGRCCGRCARCRWRPCAPRTRPAPRPASPKPSAGSKPIRSP
jgi:hypothetical protein